MQSQPRLTLIIPTFNEADIALSSLKTIEATMGPELCAETEVLFVDDGTDTLPSIIANAKTSFASLVCYHNNPGLGKGRSIALGIEKAKGKIIGFMDVDLSTPPTYIKPALEEIESGKCDSFIGSRRAEGSNIQRNQFWLKDVLGHLLGVMARGIIFWGMRTYTDTQCGFKFFRAEIAKVLYTNLLAWDGLTDLEILIKANLLGVNVQERGVTWIDLRESKRQLRRILFGEIKSMLRILVHYKLGIGQERRQIREVLAKGLLEKKTSNESLDFARQ